MASRFYQPNKLALRSGHSEILGFEFKRFFVIAVIEKLEPVKRGRSRLIFIGAFLGV